MQQADKNDLVILGEDQKKGVGAVPLPAAVGEETLVPVGLLPAVEQGVSDVVAMMCVTVGDDCAEYEKKLFENGDFTEYLYIHGIGVQTAESLAEMWHKRVRQELGIAAHDGPTMRDLFSCHYQGCRYSFGYPACPDVQDNEKLVRSGPDRLFAPDGKLLHHAGAEHPGRATRTSPQAKYFNVD